MFMFWILKDNKKFYFVKLFLVNLENFLNIYWTNCK